MPRLSVSQNPSYRKHRSSGQAIVTLSGRDFYLGPHNTAASKREYDRLIALWRNAGRTLAFADTSSELSVMELLDAFWVHAQGHYVDDNGCPTSELAIYKRLLKTLKSLFGRIPVSEFGPIKLKTVREHLVKEKLSRPTVNRYVHRLRNIFRWGVENELVQAQVYQSLRAVSALLKGKTEAEDTAPVTAVSDEIVQETLAHMPATVADMVRLQRLTGARPEEICILRSCDIDRGSDVWLYRPAHHKCQHRGKDRLIHIGPKAQSILLPYLLRPSHDFCFSPQESEEKRRAELHEQRRTPLSYGNRPGSNRRSSPKREPRKRYTTCSYRRAIHRACEVAFKMPIALRYPQRQVDAEGNPLSNAEVEVLQRRASEWRQQHCWSPNQLRHTAATEIRRQFGLEASQVILGHQFADTTQIYAERNTSKAIDVMRQIG